MIFAKRREKILSPKFRFPDPITLGVGTFYGVQLGDQSRSRMAKQENWGRRIGVRS